MRDARRTPVCNLQSIAQVGILCVPVTSAVDKTSMLAKMSTIGCVAAALAMPAMLADPAHARLILPDLHSLVGRVEANMKIHGLGNEQNLTQLIESYYESGVFPSAGRTLEDKTKEARAFLREQFADSNNVGVSVAIVYGDQVSHAVPSRATFRQAYHI